MHNNRATPLHEAVWNLNANIVKELLKHPNVDVNVGRKLANMSNCTCLHYAAEYGQLEIVKALLAAGANVNALTSQNISPLHSAVKSNHIEICKLLLEVSVQCVLVSLNSIIKLLTDHSFFRLVRMLQL